MLREKKEETCEGREEGGEGGETREEERGEGRKRRDGVC